MRLTKKSNQIFVQLLFLNLEREISTETLLETCKERHPRVRLTKKSNQIFVQLLFLNLERETGLEPATATLAR